MKSKKIISAALSLLLAFGSFTVLPESALLSTSIQADAAQYMLYDKRMLDGSIFPKVKNFVVTMDGTSATLSWSSVSGASSYTVMYSTTLNKDDDSWLFLSYEEVKTTFCTITGLSEDKSYYFAIMANDSSKMIPIASTFYDEEFTPMEKDSTSTADSSIKDFVIQKDSDGNKYIAGYKGKGGVVTLPKDYYVGEGAFKGNKDITNIIAPNDYYFNNYAFEDCINLKSVKINGNATFGGNAFYDCINLKSVTIEGGIDSGIGAGAFSCCQSLTDFTVKKSSSDFFIGQNAFYNCISLKSFTVPEKCTEIYTGAFLNCFDLEKITVPADTKFNSEKGKYHMGYFSGAKTEDEAYDGVFFSEDVFYYGVADGKTAIYTEYLSETNGVELENGLMLDVKKFVPKKLIMYVAKGSDAEKYAKENKIAYEYTSSKTTKLAAPQNLKQTKKTANTVTLKWSAVDGADKYIVYLYNSETKKYEKYSTVKSAKCTIKNLKKGTSYKVKVTPVQKVNGKNKKGTASKAITVKTSSK